MQINSVEELISLQNNILPQITNDWHKYLYSKLETKEKLLGLRGLRGVGKTTKPGKIYFENTCFAYAFQTKPNVGTIRETFVANQLSNAGYPLHLSDKGDFLINEKWVLEVGGKNKGSSQIKDVENGYLALDNIEQGYGQRIPLWLFGFLY